MGISPLDRRQFIAAGLALLAPLLCPVPALAAESRTAPYAVDVGILYNMLGLRLAGTLKESIDREAGRYEITASGQGSQIANGLISRGILRSGRWAPLGGQAWFDIAGRRSESEVTYDYGRRVIVYHYRGETFFLRRQRVADDTLAMPPDHVDDVFSALLNHAEGRWPARPDGRRQTLVVRREKPPGEGPDDVKQAYRAELVPLVLEPGTDAQAGRPTADFDLSRFSSWARDGKPARIVFGPDGRPERITASLILGTSFSIRLGGD